MIQNFEYNGEKYPYKTGYFVFKDFQNETGKSIQNFAELSLENIAYLHYLGFKYGAKDAKKPCAFQKFSDFEEFVNEDFTVLGKLEDVFLKFMPDPEEEGK